MIDHVLSIAANTATVPVEVVTDGGGFGAGDLVTPLLTFLGGIAAIWLGAKLTRRTLTNIEQDKARRETAIEDERAARELATEMRLAAGIARVLLVQLQASERLLATSIDLQTWWPGPNRCAIDLRPEDELRLAAHLQEEAWETLSLCRHVLTILDNQRAIAAAASDGGSTHAVRVQPDTLRPDLQSVRNAQAVVSDELVRLRANANALVRRTG
jgi:hypothetical protein